MKHISSTYKILYLLHLLINNDCTKNDIINAFKNENIIINRASINNYIDKLISNGFEIEIKQKSKENLYSIKKNYVNLSFSENELNSLNEAKKLLLLEKDYNRIRKTMRIFYKFALFIDDMEQRENFIDFGYYSSIDWGLVLELEEHCREKNVIMIDYVLPSGENKFISLHVDRLKIGEWSQRLYLYGIFQGADKFSSLPVDRIYMVKKIIQKNVRFNVLTDIITYKISNEMYQEKGLDKIEILSKQDEKYATILRPLMEDFYLVQRLLYFCPDLYYVSDENLKNKIKEKLKTIKGIYDDKFDK